MFHIAEKIYLGYDYAFNQQYPYMIASERWGTRPMITIGDAAAPLYAASFSTMIAEKYSGDLENFWKDIISKEGKFIVFLDADTLSALQIQYWKNIFSDTLTVIDMHLLHTSWVESRQLEAQFNRVGTWDNVTKTWNRPNAHTELKLLTLTEIQILMAAATMSPTLMALDKNKVSFEYLLADYLVDSASPYTAELIRRIKELSWDNWVDELEHLKYEILAGAIAADKLDPSLNITIGNIESELAKSSMLRWTIDPAFGTDVAYIRSAYDYTIFVECWEALARAWGHNKHEYYDMEELSTLINTDQYEKLLAMDIARNYGCAHTSARYLSKTNQVFATYCYDRKRNNSIADLSRFVLRR